MTDGVVAIKAGFDRLREVGPRMEKKVYNRGVNRGVRYVQLSMRAHLAVHTRTGTLARSIKTKVKQYRRGGVTVGMIGVPSWSAGEAHGKQIIAPKYSHFVTRPRKGFWQAYPKGSKRLRWIGPNTPDDYVAKALADSKSGAVSAVAGAVNEAIG